MGLTVKQRGQHVATFRFVEVRLMEMLAGWIPSTAQMEAKLLFGPHVWDCAQAADALGKRAHELRLPLQHAIAPVPAYLCVLDELKATQEAAQRIAGFYDVVLPSMGARYRRYLAQTDPLMDAPTVRIIERILEAHARMLGEAAALREQLPALRPGEPLRTLIEADAVVGDLPVEDDGQRQAA